MLADSLETVADHGTSAMYVTRKCRCDVCRAWNRNRQRDRRAGKTKSKNARNRAPAKHNPIVKQTSVKRTPVKRTSVKRAAVKQAPIAKPARNELLATPDSIEKYHGSARQRKIKLFWEYLHAQSDAQAFLKEFKIWADRNNIPSNEYAATLYNLFQLLGVIPRNDDSRKISSKSPRRK